MFGLDFDDLLVQPTPAPLTPTILPSPVTQNAFNFSVSAPSGPLNNTYKIPPRPKPGRKPATDEPQTKRKAQNREAQRNFRQRKAQRLTELEGERERKDREHEEEKETLKRQIENLDHQVRQLTESEQYTQRRLNDAMEQLRIMEDERNHYKSLYESSATPSMRGGYGHEASTPSSMAGASISSPAFDSTPLTNPSLGDGRSKSGLSGCDTCQPGRGNCACVNSITARTGLDAPLSPLSDVRMRDADERSNYDDREIDFTTSRVDKRPSVSFITGPIDDGCGFCTDDSNCICAREREAEAAREAEQEALARGEQTTLPPIRSLSGYPSNNKEGSRRGPGTCQDCQSNPRQRQWCQSMASNSSTRRHSRPIKHATGSSTRYSVGCTDTYRLFNKHAAKDSMDWAPDLEALPPGAAKKIYFNHLQPDSRPEAREYTAVEIDSASILTGLNNVDRRHSDDQKKDPVVQKTVRFLEDVTRHGQPLESGAVPLRTRGSMGSIGHILN